MHTGVLRLMLRNNVSTLSYFITGAIRSRKICPLYCIQINYRSIRNRDSIYDTCFVGTQAVGPSSRMFWLRFPREFSSLFRVSRGQFVLLRGLSVGSTWSRWNRCVTSREKLSYRLQALGSLFFDVTALLSFEFD